MAYTYQVTEVTDTYTYAVITREDGSSFGKMFFGLVAADKAEFDDHIGGYIAEQEEIDAEIEARSKKKYDGKDIIRQPQPIEPRRVQADELDQKLAL